MSTYCTETSRANIRYFCESLLNVVWRVNRREVAGNREQMLASDAKHTSPRYRGEVKHTSPRYRGEVEFITQYLTCTFHQLLIRWSNIVDCR